MTYVIFVSGADMHHFLKLIMLLSTLTLCTVLPVVSFPHVLADNSPNSLVIEGLVSNPLNLTYTEVESLPQVSETALLKCVYAPSGAPYNWTGVPIFYLLNLAEVRPGATKVVFRATDGFSSSLTLDKAMHPTTLLALKVNGTTLPETQNSPEDLPAGYPYKIVAPCKQGYKWVGWVNEIEVVDYDYNGTYESRGFSDDASIPNCTALPETEPAYTTLKIVRPEECNVTVFSNSTLDSARFNETTGNIQLSVVTENNSSGFAYLIVPRTLLYLDFLLFSDGTPMQGNLTQSPTNSFIYFTLDQGTHHIEIKGVIPGDVTGPRGVSDGRVDMGDIVTIVDAFGSQTGQIRFNPKCDLELNGRIDMGDVVIVLEHFGQHYP